MNTPHAPRGLIVDLVTPFRSNGSVDGRGLGRLLASVVPHAQAILIAGPHAGEGPHLTLPQKSELLNKAMVAVGGRVPLFVWVTRDTTHGTVETVRTLQERVAKRKYEGQIFWIDAPLYHHSNRGLPSHFQELSGQVTHPFILYNHPGMVRALDKTLKRVNIRTSILKELSGLEMVAGLIFFGTLDRFHNYQKACRFHGSFRIYDGDEGMFLRHPSSAGVVSPGANLAPRAWQKITRAALRLDTDQQEYPDHQQQIWELGNFLYQLQSTYGDCTAGAIKETLSRMGILESSRCISPQPDLDEITRRAMGLMQRYGRYP